MGNNSSDNQKFEFEDFIEGIKTKKFQKISFFTGAGISVSSGIPDFRSEDGIYAQLRKSNKYNLSYPEQMFDIDYYQHQPKPFLTLAKEFLNKDYFPNIAHYFQKLVEQSGQLYKIYTQNVDGLELNAGVTQNNLVQAHGHLRTAHCATCKETADINTFKNHILKDEVYNCQKCGGNVKPDVVFFHEGLPWSFYWNYFKISNCDLAIIMGTSLTVQPFAMLIDKIKKTTPVVLINRDTCPINPKFTKFIHLGGDMNVQIEKIIQSLGWQNELQKLKQCQQAAKF